MLWYCNMSDLKFRPYKEHHTGLRVIYSRRQKMFPKLFIVPSFNSVQQCSSLHCFPVFPERLSTIWSFPFTSTMETFFWMYTDIFCECGTHRSLVHYSPIMVVHVVNKYIFWKFRRQGKLIRCVLTLKSS